MKMLCAHVKNLRIEAGVGGKTNTKRRAEQRKLRERLGDSLPLLDESNRLITSENALLAFVCVEKSDEKINLWIVKNDIVKAMAMLRVAEIVMGAFGHLSEIPADPATAKRIVDDLIELVKMEYSDTKTFPFGWDKSLEINVPLHHYNFAFKSYPPSP